MWEHLASTWTLRAHTYTPVVSDGQRRLLAQPEQIVLQALELTEAQMSARTHAHAHTHSVSQSLSGGPASKSSFPEGFDHAFRSIWQKHQQTPSGVKDFLSSFFLFPPLPCSSNTDMHPAHSHSCRPSQIICLFYFDAPVLFGEAHIPPSLSFPPFYREQK